jgi:phospholipid/cholesterol/gamma-HCH transport system substrate-binding protein
VRRPLSNLLALGLIVVTAIAVGGYIMRHQRMRLPVIDATPLRLEAEMPSAQAVTPGQGQTVTVAGVKIGTIAGVKLVDGRARVQLDIDPAYKTMVRTDATALLRPRTALKDMFLELDPGRPSAPAAKKGFVIPVSNTAADVNEDEILASLDGDTRDYLQLLANGGGVALARRGKDLSDILLRFEPTHRDLAHVTTAVGARHAELRRLVGSLARLNTELARQPAALTRLVGASATTLDALARESPAITASLRGLPGALRDSRTALRSTGTLARVLTPTAERLRPAARNLAKTDDALRPLARTATPVLRTRLRPFVREARPLVRDLRPAAQHSAQATPDVTRVFKVVNVLLNELAYNPRTKPGPFDGSGTEGYLFWAAWADHIGATLFSSEDAHNIYRPTALGMACDTIRETVTTEPQLEFLWGLTGILSSPLGCKERG